MEDCTQNEDCSPTAIQSHLTVAWNAAWELLQIETDPKKRLRLYDITAAVKRALDRLAQQ